MRPRSKKDAATHGDLITIKDGGLRYHTATVRCLKRISRRAARRASRKEMRSAPTRKMNTLRS